jgi:hypothetical protein
MFRADRMVMLEQLPPKLNIFRLIFMPLAIVDMASVPVAGEVFMCVVALPLANFIECREAPPRVGSLI